MLVALKCDLRSASGEEEEGDGSNAGSGPGEKTNCIDYNHGLDVARRINALRYLECSAKKNRGVNEAFTEAARVALSVKSNGGKEEKKCLVM